MTLIKQEKLVFILVILYIREYLCVLQNCDPLRRNETCPPDLTFIDMNTRLTSNSRAFQWYKCYFRNLFHSGIIERWREPSRFALRRKSTLNLDHTQSKRASYRSMYNSWIINQPLYQTPAVHTGPRLHSACCVWSRGVRCLCCGRFYCTYNVHCAKSRRQKNQRVHANCTVHALG